MIPLHISKYFSFVNVGRTQSISTLDREALTRNLSQFRRAILREFVFGILRTFSDFEFTLPLMATLLLLEEERELTIKQIAELLGRSVSTTSRLVDQLVERDLISRREDEHDRRMKRVAITENGRKLISVLEQRRAEAQIDVMEYLSAGERAEVARGMALLAEASLRRSRNEHAASRTTE
jgi:DNA-binding MarR family transcriptional regulator